MPTTNIGASSGRKPHGVRAVGIVLHDGKLLVMRRDHDGLQYFTFPGGGVEPGETVEEAVAREIREETSLVVVVDRLLYHHDLLDDSDQYFYQCHYVSGQVALGGEELEESKRGDVHEPLWVETADLPTLTLYPLEVRDWLIADIERGFSATPRTLSIHPRDLRSV
jgi:ADP-ribose pyrophosphatase YjhB (NUDIX family)